MPSSVFNHTYVSPSTPIIMLSTKNHEVLGFINNFDKQSVNINFNMNSANEISFDIYREVDGVKEPLWDSIIDFKYIYVKQADEFGNKIYEEFYTIEVSIDDGDDTVKHITGTSACEFELSKRMLYGLEINTETDFKAQETNGEIPKGGDYISTKFYDSENPKYSLLHRVLNDHNAAINDYQIRYVSPSLCNIERKYTADGKDIYSFLTGDVAKETECLFAFNSVERGVYVYDLKFVCDSCGKRGEPAAVCPHCGSASYASVFGENTNLYISAENYAEQITRTGKTDNVFNCLRISGGDEIINTAIAYVNPNGTRYVYSFSEDMLNDMPVELKNKILAYNTLYQSKQAEYQQKSEAYYNAVDRKYELQHSMMPEVTTPTTTADEQASQLPGKFSDFGDVYVADITTISTTSANLAVQGMAAVLCDARYKATATGTITTYTTGTTYVTWTGTVKIENYGRSEDNAITSSFSVIVRDGSETSTGYANFLEQRILKKLDRDDSTFFDIFTIPYVEPGDATFKAELKKYGLASLKGFYQSYDTCLSVLTETGDSDPNKKFNSLVPKPYDVMYKPYHDRQVLVANEMRVRETELFGVGGTEELPTGGVQQTINNLNVEIKAIHDLLNFKNYIGDELYQVFSHYRMESSYSNSNYISTGLDTPRLFENATALYEMGLTEVYKASQLQYTLNCTLNDLLLDKYEDTTLTSEDGTLFFQRFTPYIDAFQLGNWLSLKSDEKIFYLRLLSISVDYGSLDNISVTFSEALQVNGIISDAQSILEQAKSMASSYDTVAHQATEGEDAQYRVEDWLQNGLDAALTTLKNSNSEDVVFDKNGIMSRSYDDITETYSPKQLRITSRVLAFTDDNWESAKLALGESLFSRYDEDNDQFISERGYGLLAEYLNGSYITGSQIVGGDIYSTNYSETNHVGSHIDLNTGYFSLAGGHIRYDGDTLYISVGNNNKDISEAIDTVTIEYAKNTSPSVAPTSGWQSTQPARVAGEYLWQRTTITYLSGEDPTVTTVNITGIDGEKGDQGDPGEPGEPGAPGADGRGISRTDDEYQISNSGTTIPTGTWYDKDHIPATTDSMPYLWTRTTFYYTEGNPSRSYSVSKQPKDGTPGGSGASVTYITTKYCLTNSVPTKDSPLWQNSLPPFTLTAYNDRNYKYYHMDVTTLSEGDPIKGDVVADDALTTSNRNAFGAEHDLENSLCLRLDTTTGRIVTATLKEDPSTSQAEFQVAADNITFVSDGNIQLNSQTIGINSNNFKVTKNGDLTCSNANVSGTITATAGKIGGWDIGTDSIYHGTNSMSSDIQGTYIGTNGIRQYNNSNNYLTIKNAAIESHYSASNFVRIANGGLRFIGDDGKITVSGTDGTDQRTVLTFGYDTAAYVSIGSPNSSTISAYFKVPSRRAFVFTDSNIEDQKVLYTYDYGQGRHLSTANSITISELQCLSGINTNVSTALIDLQNEYTTLQAQVDSLDPSSATVTANKMLISNSNGKITAGTASSSILNVNSSTGLYTASRVLISDSNGKISTSDFNSTLFAVCAPHATHGATNNLFNERGRVLLSADSSYGSTNNGRIVTSDITIAELDCLDGVSSNIQTQLNGKASSSTVSTLSTNLSSLTNTVNNLSASDVGAVPTSRKVNGYSLSSNVTLGVSDISSQIPLGAPSKITNNLFNDGNRVVYTGNTGYLMTSSVTGTELGYLSGVTSNIQTQLDSKISSTNGAISTVVSSNLTSNRALISNGSGKIAVSSVTSTELGYLSGLTKKITSLTASDVGAVPTSRTVNGHALSSNVTVTASDLGLDTVGTYKSATGSNTSISKSTATSVCSITLGKGTWVIVGRVRIPLISDGTLFQAGIGTSISDTYLFNCINGGNKIGVCEVLDLTSSSNTVYLIAYHDRSSSITTTGSNTWLHAVRIK